MTDRRVESVTDSGHESSAATKPRIKASTARLMLAREMWAHDSGAYSYLMWDTDALLSATYEKWIAKADALIREAMARGD